MWPLCRPKIIRAIYTDDIIIFTGSTRAVCVGYSDHNGGARAIYVHSCFIVSDGHS